MRPALFSDHEREMVKRYLETDVKPPGFRTLVFRVRRAQIQIIEDFDLMIRLLTKLENPVRLIDEEKEK